MPMKRIDSINVIPFIDIMLVLLAIVLATATFIARGVVTVDLPQASDVSAGPAETVSVMVREDGRVFVDDAPRTIDQLAADVAALPGTAQVVVSVDRRAAFEDFFKVVDLLKTRGVETVSIQAAKR